MTFMGHQPPWLVVLFFCAAILLYVGFVPLGYPGIIKQHYGLSIPEVHPFKDTLLGFLRALKPEGLPIYRQELERDVWFAIGFGLLLASLADQLFARALTSSERWLRGLVFIPIFYLLADVGEDFALLRTIRDSNLGWNGEEVRLVEPSIAQTARAFTGAKWLFLVGSVALITAGGVLLAWRGAPTG
jgi:hypothetical protein